MEARRYAHRIPFIVKINHNQLLTYPNEFDQIMFGSVRQAYELGAVGVGATIYFGSEQSSRQIIEVSEAFEEAHALGMFTVLWCYLRNSAFKTDNGDMHVAADLTGQANHLGVTIEADIIKQKQPERNGGYNALKGFGKTDPLVYDKLTTDHPIDLTRWQVVNNYMGRVPLINSGGESAGDSDLAQAVRTAVINKRAGGAGLIVGRKAFQRPMPDGVALLNTIQDVYLDESITRLIRRRRRARPRPPAWRRRWRRRGRPAPPPPPPAAAGRRTGAAASARGCGRRRARPAGCRGRRRSRPPPRRSG